jgi:hypothetical protein
MFNKEVVYRYNKINWSELENNFKDINNFLNITNNITKVNRQLDNLEFPELKNLITKELEDKIKKDLQYVTYQFVKETKDLINKPENSIPKDLINKIHLNKMLLLDSISRIMDMYLVARMFRKFRKVDGVPSEPPTNIVI